MFPAAEDERLSLVHPTALHTYNAYCIEKGTPQTVFIVSFFSSIMHNDSEVEILAVGGRGKPSSAPAASRRTRNNVGTSHTICEADDGNVEGIYAENSLRACS